MSKLDKAKKIAQTILEKLAPTVDDALALTGKEKDEYLKALDTVYGDREKRALDLGFGEKTYYHGTKAKDKIDEFSLDKASAGSSIGKGIYTSENKKLPEAYADRMGGGLYDLRIKDIDKLADADKVLTKKDLNAFKKNLDPDVYAYLLRNDDLTVGSSTLGISMRRAAWESQEAGKAFDVKKAADDLGIIGLKNEPRETVIYKPENIRSVDANFDPRFKNSSKIMAGAAAIPTATDEFKNLPQEVLGKAAQVYEDVKDKTLQFLIDKTRIGKELPTDAVTDERFKQAAGLIADPINMVSGPVGVGLGAMQMMAPEPKEKIQTPEGYSDGGMVTPNEGLIDEKEFVPTVPQVFDPTGMPAQVDYNSLIDSYKQGGVAFRKGDDVPMISPVGDIVNIKSDDLDLAIDQGFKFDSPDEQTKRYIMKKYESTPEQVQAALEGVARGVSIGFSDPLLVKLGMSQQAMRMRKETNPELAMGGEAAGIFAPMLLTMGGSTAAQLGARGAVSAISKATPVMLAQRAGQIAEGALATRMGVLGAETLGKQVLRSGVPKMAGSAVEASLYGVGKTFSEDALGEADLTAEHLMSNVTSSALLGGAIGGAVGGAELAAPYLGKAVDKTKKALDKTAKKAVSGLFGVSEETLENYITRKASKEFALTPELDDLVIDYQNQVGEIVDGFKDAKIDFKDAQSSFKNLKNQTIRDLKIKGEKASDAERIAKGIFDEAEESFAKSRDINIMNTAPVIAQDMAKLRNRVTEFSKTVADDTLSGVDVKINVNSIIDDLASKAKEYGTENSQGVSSKLKDWLALNDDKFVDGKISGIELKKLIQGIDKDTTYSMNASHFDQLKNNFFKQLRFNLDDALKEASPVYRDLMQGVAAETKLLKNLNKYGDEITAAKSLKNFDDIVKTRYDLPMLKELEDMMGSSYTKDIEAYLNLQDDIVKMPQYKAFKESKEIARALKSKEHLFAIEDALKNTDEYKAFAMNEKRLVEAKLKAAGLEGITDRSIPTLFKQAAESQDPIRSRVALEKIKKLEVVLNNPELSRMLKDAGLKSAFEKGFTRGSSNVVTWGVVGEVMGQMLGFMGGGIPGVIIGKMIDRQGPKVAKILMDKYTTLAAMERMGINTAKIMSDKINKFLNVESLGEGVRLRSVAPGVLLPEPDKKKPVSKMTYNDFKKKSKELSKEVADLDSFLNKMSDQVKPLYRDAPNTASQLINKSAVALQFLHDKMPKDPTLMDNMSQDFSVWRPSDSDLASFERYYNAVNDPLTVFDKLESGSVTFEEVEALQVVYPKMFQSLTQYMVEALAELEKPLPYEKRITLATLFGVPLDQTFNSDYLLAVQSLHTNKQQVASSQSQPQVTGRSIKVSPNIVKSRMTDTQKTLTRA